MSEEFIIKCRGVPFSTTAQDVVKFLHDVNIRNGEKGVHLPKNKDGRASGVSFVELASEEDVAKAEAHHKEHMGSRYIEVSVAERSEMDWFVNRQPGMGGANNDGFVRLRGLPFEATKNDIANFFSGFCITPYGITITMDQVGRPSGEAYVEFTTPDQVEKALTKNKEKIGHRYIEIFNSSRHDVRYVTEPSFNQDSSYYGGGGGGGGGGPQRGGMGGGRSGPYDRPGGGRGGFQGGWGGGRQGDSMTPRVQNSSTGFMVHMRGLPFEATQGDVFKFFSPLNPCEVRILYEDTGRPKGEADVDFSCHADAEKAMEKNKQNMGPRYIELFLRCTNNAGGGGGGGWGDNSNSTPLMGGGGWGGFGSGGGGGGNYNNSGFNAGGYGGGSGGNVGYSWNYNQGSQAAGGYGGGNYYSNNSYN